MNRLILILFRHIYALPVLMKVVDEQVSHPAQAFVFMRLQLERFAGPRHRHAELELTWIERGSGLRLVGEQVQPFADGDLVLLGPQLPHVWSSTARTRANGPLHATVLQFPASLFAQRAFPELAAAAVLVSRAAGGLMIRGATHHAVTQHLRAMADAAPLERLASFVRIIQALLAADADLQTITTQPRRSPARREDGVARIDRVIEWIHAHLATVLDVEQAARIAHVSPQAFSRFFRRETGRTFTAYVNDLRVSLACLRLRQGREPIARIAAQCGFSNLAHFNRQFKLRQGCTPRAYRAP